MEATDEVIRIWVTASPTDGQANDAVCKLLARSLSLAPSRVAILRGETSRDKVIAIEGVERDEALRRLSGKA